MSIIYAPIASLALYVIGFFTANIVLITIALVIGIISFIYIRRQYITDSLAKICNIGSIALITVGVVYFVVLLISVFIVVPALDAIM